MFGGTAGRLVGLPGPHTSDPVAPPPAFAPVGGRAFVDVTAVLRNPIGRTIATFVLKFMEARTGVVLRELLDDPAFAPVPHGRRRALRRIGPVLVRFRVPLVIAQAVASPAAASRRVARLGARAAAFPPSAPDATGAERLERATAALASALPAFPGSAPAFAAGFLMRGVARRLAGDDLDDVTMDAVLRSLPNNVTTEMDLQLWALAQRVRSDPDSADALGVGDGTDARRPVPRRHPAHGAAGRARRVPAPLRPPRRRRDRPRHAAVARAARARARRPGELPAAGRDPAAAPDVRFAAGEQVAQRAVADVVARVRRRSRWRARAVGFALGRVRELVGLREAPKDHLVRLIALARDELAAVGAELAARGLLDDPGDVFFLDLHDVAAALDGADLRAVVGSRREEYARELRRRHVPRVLLSDGTEPEALARAGAPDDGALVGSPASAGTVTAPARVVLDPVGARLEPGEVLVAPSTDPGWTPLFLTAGGLVMEMGGPNSHGAVVAREYGIPAVVGVPEATVADRDRCPRSPWTAPQAASTSPDRRTPPDRPRGAARPDDTMAG